eukprot:gene1347-32709_t
MLNMVAPVNATVVHNGEQLCAFSVSSTTGDTKIIYADTVLNRNRWVKSIQASIYLAQGKRLLMSDWFKVKYSSLLGTGLFAMVVAGEDISSGPPIPVAIKIIKSDAFKNYRDLMEREACVWSALGFHKNIVTLNRVLHSNKRMYFVSELCDGGGLVDYVAKIRTYCERDASKIFRQLLDAVGHIHSKGIVHMDLKPENIVMQTKAMDSPLKVLDFGLASFCGMPTEPGGTPEFVAPEILIDPDKFAEDGGWPSVDMWALGILLFYLLSGQTPFNAPTMDKIIEKVKAGTWGFRGKRWSNVSTSARDLISRLLQVEPNKRLTVAQALDHKWVKYPGYNSETVLDDAIDTFKVHSGASVNKSSWIRRSGMVSEWCPMTGESAKPGQQQQGMPNVFAQSQAGPSMSSTSSSGLDGQQLNRQNVFSNTQSSRLLNMGAGWGGGVGANIGLGDALAAMGAGAGQPYHQGGSGMLDATAYNAAKARRGSEAVHSSLNNPMYRSLHYEAVAPAGGMTVVSQSPQSQSSQSQSSASAKSLLHELPQKPRQLFPSHSSKDSQAGADALLGLLIPSDWTMPPEDNLEERTTPRIKELQKQLMALKMAAAQKQAPGVQDVNSQLSDFNSGPLQIMQRWTEQVTYRNPTAPNLNLPLGSWQGLSPQQHSQQLARAGPASIGTDSVSPTNSFGLPALTSVELHTGRLSNNMANGMTAGLGMATGMMENHPSAGGIPGVGGRSTGVMGGGGAVGLQHSHSLSSSSQFAQLASNPYFQSPAVSAQVAPVVELHRPSMPMGGVESAPSTPFALSGQVMGAAELLAQKQERLKQLQAQLKAQQRLQQKRQEIEGQQVMRSNTML